MGVDIIGNEKRRPTRLRNMPSVTVPRAGLEYANLARRVCVEESSRAISTARL